MSPEENSLLHIAEECLEVAQECLLTAHRVMKALRFGGDETQPGQELTNAERIMAEFDDLTATIAVAQEAGLIPLPSPERIAAKRAKILKYRALSEQLGTITPTPPAP